MRLWIWSCDTNTTRRIYFLVSSTNILIFYVRLWIVLRASAFSIIQEIHTIIFLSVLYIPWNFLPGSEFFCELVNFSVRFRNTQKNLAVSSAYFLNLSVRFLIFLRVDDFFCDVQTYSEEFFCQTSVFFEFFCQVMNFSVRLWIFLPDCEFFCEINIFFK